MPATAPLSLLNRARSRQGPGRKLLYTQLYVYNPLLDASGKSDVVLQAQIWAGGKTVAASRPEPVVFDENDGTRAFQTNSFPSRASSPVPTSSGSWPWTARPASPSPAPPTSRSSSVSST